MKPRFRLFRRKNGIFFVEDRITRKQASLQTRERAIARQLFHARNEAYRQPALNLQIARTCLPASDVGFVQRTWRDVMAEFLKNKTGPNRIRSEHAVAEKAFDSLRDLPLLDTRPEHFLRVLESGGVSTNSYLRRFHNFAADPGWLPWPVMPKRQWPKVRYQEKRAVAQAKHERILSHDQRACCRVGVTGVSLHSYRYAWAERAKTAGYPERFAQVALSHNSKAVHRAYARKAQVRLPALGQYETAPAPPRAEEP